MIGCDIIEVDRVKRLKAPNRVFTINELEYAQKYKNPYIHLAGFFALKEAVIKAFDIPLNIWQVEVLHKDNGAPYVRILKELDNQYEIECSISNIESLAMAVAIVTKKQ